MHAIPATVAYGHRIKFSSAFYVRCITFPSPWPLPRYVHTVRAGEARDGKPLNINIPQYSYPDPLYASHNHTATLRICIFRIGTSTLIWLFLFGGIVPTGSLEPWWRFGLGWVRGGGWAYGGGQACCFRRTGRWAKQKGKKRYRKSSGSGENDIGDDVDG
jgi:hypothetical protein